VLDPGGGTKASVATETIRAAFSSSIESWLQHEVHDPRSQVAVIATSATGASSRIISGGAPWARRP